MASQGYQQQSVGFLLHTTTATIRPDEKGEFDDLVIA